MSASSYHPEPSHGSPALSSSTRDGASDVAWEDTSAVFELRVSPSHDHTLEATGTSCGAPVAEVQALGDVGELFSTYRWYVAKIGRRILGSSSELDDLIQDVFLATVKDAHKIKDPARLRAWLATVTTRMAKRRRFRSAVHPTLSREDPDEIINLTSVEGPSPESTADLSGNIQSVLSLPEELRTPWLLKHVDGLTLQAVAQKCDCSLSTAARRIQTASGRITRRG
jgi:RNA polymerase sigma-70 factor, ECF subfamily